MKAIKIETNGDITELDDTSLEALQKAVGGYIELVYLRLKPYEYKGHNFDLMIVDEEGLPKQKEFNPIGRQIYAENTRPNTNPIVGDIVLTYQKHMN